MHNPLLIPIKPIRFLDADFLMKSSHLLVPTYSPPEADFRPDINIFSSFVKREVSPTARLSIYNIAN